MHRPNPGEELIHAEGLGEEVVGAHVQSGDLVPLGVSGKEAMIGTVVHPRRPATTSTPSISGRPRSRMIRSGGWDAAAFSAAARPQTAVTV